MAKRKTVSEAIKKFLKTTTLHGFKYLTSEYFVDRFIWLLCCCASACCAAVLCGVLWARFLKVPALLALHDAQKHDSPLYNLPMLAVCPAVEAVAELFIGKLTSNETLKKQLPNILARALNGKPSKKDHLRLLDQLLADNNVTLHKIMHAHLPPCCEVVQKCRWQRMNIPCENLFMKKFTNGRVCCVMRSNMKLISSSKKAKLLASLEVGQKIELALQCSNGSTLYGCEFFTKYDGEVWVDPEWLNPGSNYIAQLRFISIPESTTTEKFVEESCIAKEGYSINDCLVGEMTSGNALYRRYVAPGKRDERLFGDVWCDSKEMIKIFSATRCNECAENICGCANPLRDLVDNSTYLPPCPFARLACLQTNGLYNNGTCNCLPTCKKITTYMTLESSPLKFVDHVIDPIYRGLNVTSSIVMYFRVNIQLSTTFILTPTETWLTLLSSLGGVFNMFLGVGLFSALELLTLMFVKFPMAIRRSSEISPLHDNKM